MACIQSLPCKGPIGICRICPQAKQHKSSFPLNSSRTNKIFEMLHVDIWDPYRRTTYDGFKFFLSIFDDYSRATWVLLLSHKSNAFSMLKSFIAYIATNFILEYRSSGLIIAMSFEIDM